MLSWPDEQHTLLFFLRKLAVLAPIFDMVMSLLEKISGIKSGRKVLGEVNSAGTKLLVPFCSSHLWLWVLVLEETCLEPAVDLQMS